MKDGVHPAGEYRLHLHRHRDVAAQILGSRRHSLAPAVGLVVHHRHGVTLGEEAMANMRAYESCATCNENPHFSGSSALFRT